MQDGIAMKREGGPASFALAFGAIGVSSLLFVAVAMLVLVAICGPGITDKGTPEAWAWAVKVLGWMTVTFGSLAVGFWWLAYRQHKFETGEG